VANDTDKSAGESARGAYADCAFEYAVFFFVDGGACEHAGEAPETLIHAVRT
jgi:hypothetical protein